MDVKEDGGVSCKTTRARMAPGSGFLFMKNQDSRQALQYLIPRYGRRKNRGKELHLQLAFASALRRHFQSRTVPNSLVIVGAVRGESSPLQTPPHHCYSKSRLTTTEK